MFLKLGFDPSLSEMHVSAACKDNGWLRPRAEFSKAEWEPQPIHKFSARRELHSLASFGSGPLSALHGGYARDVPV